MALDEGGCIGQSAAMYEQDRRAPPTVLVTHAGGFRVRMKPLPRPAPSVPPIDRIAAVESPAEKETEGRAQEPNSSWALVILLRYYIAILDIHRPGMTHTVPVTETMVLGNKIRWHTT